MGLGLTVNVVTRCGREWRLFFEVFSGSEQDCNKNTPLTSRKRNETRFDLLAALSANDMIYSALKT